MKKLTIFILFATLIGFNLQAQHVPFDDDYFPHDEEGFDKAEDAWEDGLDEMEDGNLRGALEFFLEAYSFNPNHANLNYYIGYCYDKTGIMRERCLAFYKKAYELNPNVEHDIHLRLGIGYHLNYEFDKAIEEFNKHKGVMSPREYEENIEDLELRIKYCQNAKELVANPVRAFIDNIGPPINSEYPEYAPVISADESMMFFTARLPNTTGEDIEEGSGQYYEDIYVSERQPDGSWGEPRNMGEPINTDNNDATVGVSGDGMKLYIFLGEKGGDIFYCEWEDGEWQDPEDLPDEVNSDYYETQAAYSPDEKTIYFVSDRAGERDLINYGGLDIFYTEREPGGDEDDWLPAKNIGSIINTKYDDRGVFMHPDGRTLYFASEGHNSMGGLDLFKTVYENGQWSKPENLGYPINTPDNDFFFVLSADGRHGYYASAKSGGEGDLDIYLITILGPVKPVVQSNEDNLIASIARPTEDVVVEKKEVKKVRLTILKGTVKDQATLEPLEAKITIIDNEQNQVVNTLKSNNVTGKYLVTLPSGKNYGIRVEKENYSFHSENFNIPPAQDYQEITKDILLQNLDIGTNIVLENIFFDFDKATLRPESQSELEKLLEFMNTNASIRVEISGHTDSYGSDEYNKDLSKRRAESVVNWLTKNGISESRLEYKGYGEEKPRATNDTDEGRQLNRRVEMTIVE